MFIFVIQKYKVVVCTFTPKQVISNPKNDVASLNDSTSTISTAQSSQGPGNGANPNL